jgi:hypothetical protein
MAALKSGGKGEMDGEAAHGLDERLKKRNEKKRKEKKRREKKRKEQASKRDYSAKGITVISEGKE